MWLFDEYRFPSIAGDITYIVLDLQLGHKFDLEFQVLLEDGGMLVTIVEAAGIGWNATKLDEIPSCEAICSFDKLAVVSEENLTVWGRDKCFLYGQTMEQPLTPLDIFKASAITDDNGEACLNFDPVKTKSSNALMENYMVILIYRKWQPSHCLEKSNKLNNNVANFSTNYLEILEEVQEQLWLDKLGYDQGVQIATVEAENGLFEMHDSSNSHDGNRFVEFATNAWFLNVKDQYCSAESEMLSSTKSELMASLCEGYRCSDIFKHNYAICCCDLKCDEPANFDISRLPTVTNNVAVCRLTLSAGAIHFIYKCRGGRVKYLSASTTMYKIVDSISPVGVATFFNFKHQKFKKITRGIGYLEGPSRIADKGSSDDINRVHVMVVEILHCVATRIKGFTVINEYVRFHNFRCDEDKVNALRTKTKHQDAKVEDTCTILQLI